VKTARACVVTFLGKQAGYTPMKRAGYYFRACLQTAVHGLEGRYSRHEENIGLAVPPVENIAHRIIIDVRPVGADGLKLSHVGSMPAHHFA
jgi:hypothetical protein